MGPKSVPNQSSKASQHRKRKRETRDQSEMRIWADLGALLGPMLGRCWAPCRLMRHLKTIKIRNIKCSKNTVNYRSDWPSGGPRDGQVGVKLGSSWAPKGILKHLNIVLPTKVNLRGVRPIPGGVVRARSPPGEGIRGGA